MPWVPPHLRKVKAQKQANEPAGEPLPQPALPRGEVNQDQPPRDKPVVVEAPGPHSPGKELPEIEVITAVEAATVANVTPEEDSAEAPNPTSNGLTSSRWASPPMNQKTSLTQSSIPPKPRSRQPNLDPHAFVESVFCRPIPPRTKPLDHPCRLTLSCRLDDKGLVVTERVEQIASQQNPSQTTASPGPSPHNVDDMASAKTACPPKMTRKNQAPVGDGHGQPERNGRWVSNKQIREQARKPLKDPSNDGPSETSDSNKDNDPDHDIRKLIDWEGNWLPGPVEWDVRPGYRDPNFYSRIELWAAGAELARLTASDAKGIMTGAGFIAPVGGEIAPRIWIPEAIDGMPLADWWLQVHVGDPQIIDPEPGEKPWWALYVESGSLFLAPLHVPDYSMDPEDPSYRRYKQDFGSKGAIDAHMEKVRETRERKKKKQKRRRAAYEAAQQDPVIDNSLKPMVAFYIRKACRRDLQGITDLYNYYVRNTCLTPELEPRQLGHFHDRFQDVLDAGLPFLVAVECSQRPDMPQLEERVIGWASADDYHDPKGIYRYAVEMEIYVNKGFLTKGVGSCLLDQMLSFMDAGYQAKGGYEFKGDPCSASRAVGDIVSYILYDSADHVRIKALQRWLERFEFKKAGELKEIGLTSNQRVSQCLFQYKTRYPANPVA